MTFLQNCMHKIFFDINYTYLNHKYKNIFKNYFYK